MQRSPFSQGFVNEFLVDIIPTSDTIDNISKLGGDEVAI